MCTFEGKKLYVSGMAKRIQRKVALSIQTYKQSWISATAAATRGEYTTAAATSAHSTSAITVAHSTSAAAAAA